jgi:hypothetical protein
MVCLQLFALFRCKKIIMLSLYYNNNWLNCTRVILYTVSFLVTAHNYYSCLVKVTTKINTKFSYEYSHPSLLTSGIYSLQIRSSNLNSRGTSYGMSCQSVDIISIKDVNQTSFYINRMRLILLVKSWNTFYGKLLLVSVNNEMDFIADTLSCSLKANYFKIINRRLNAKLIDPICWNKQSSL